MKNNIIQNSNFISNRRMDKNQSKGSNYKFAQLFGYKGPNEKILQQDIINSLKFDDSGNYLAVGDKAGRVIVFQGKEQKKGPTQFDYFTEFQSHYKEFDPLRSMEVEEQIISMEWLQPQGKYLKLATTNSRSIKLWKLFQKSEKKVVKSAGKELSIPKLQTIQSGHIAQLQKAFPKKHISPINNIAVTSNEEYMMSSDEGQLFMWSLEKPEIPYMLVNYAPKNDNEEQGEIITCSDIHPSSDSLFVYGMSKGNLKIGDLRISSNIQSTATSFGDIGPHKNYIYELLSSYSDVKFAKKGSHIVTRDCLTVKLWDVAAPKKPIFTVMLNDAIKSKLCEMVENESIFDKFQLACSPDSSSILSGGYNNTFHMVDPFETNSSSINSQYELSYKKATVVRSMVKGSTVSRMDYTTRTTAVDFNPKKNMCAVASKNCFFTYAMS